MDRLIGWLAPILSTIIITAATASHFADTNEYVRWRVENGA